MNEEQSRKRKKHLFILYHLSHYKDIGLNDEHLLGIFFILKKMKVWLLSTLGQEPFNSGIYICVAFKRFLLDEAFQQFV